MNFDALAQYILYIKKKNNSAIVKFCVVVAQGSQGPRALPCVEVRLKFFELTIVGHLALSCSLHLGLLFGIFQNYKSRALFGGWWTVVDGSVSFLRVNLVFLKV